MRQIQSNRKRPRPDKISIIPFIWKLERERNIVFPKSNQSGGKESPEHLLAFFLHWYFHQPTGEKYIYLGPDVIVLECLFLYSLSAAYKALRLSIQYSRCRNKSSSSSFTSEFLDLYISNCTTTIRLVLLLLRRLSTAPLAF